MSPRALSIQVVTLRLALMRELLADLDAVGDVDLARLESDRITRRALERILTQLVDLAADINTHVATSLGSTVTTEYRESFDAAARVGLLSEGLAARLKPSVGMRNVLIHEYVASDLTRVVAAVPLARADYGEYVRSVARWVAARS